MLKSLLRLALISAAFVPAASAVAADLDVPPPPPPPVEELRPATYDWSGAYVGAWVGATCIDGNLTDNSGPDYWEMDGCGPKGGVMAGYLHQFDSFVFGGEIDWGISGKIAENNTPGADFAFKMNHLVTGRVRGGYAFDDTLLYATGGVAWAQGDLDGINGALDPDHIKSNHMGWVFGGGIEHAFTDQFRMRLEYTYTHFKGKNYNDACCDVDVDDFGDHEIKVGAIWAF